MFQIHVKAEISVLGQNRNPNKFPPEIISNLLCITQQLDAQKRPNMSSQATPDSFGDEKNQSKHKESRPDN